MGEVARRGFGRGFQGAAQRRIRAASVSRVCGERVARRWGEWWESSIL